MTTQHWLDILQLHKSKGCTYDGIHLNTHTCANATRGKIVERKPIPDYQGVVAQDAELPG